MKRIIPRPGSPEPEVLLDRIRASTTEVRGHKNRGHDALLFLNTQYETFPVFLQQESLISSNAKIVFNNLWIWAKTKQVGTTPTSLFPDYEYISRATSLGRGTIASCLTQLRLQRYLTLVQRVRSNQGYHVGNDYILNDEPMELSDTLSIDKDYIDFVNTNLYHRHQSVSQLAGLIQSSIESHIIAQENPFRPSTHMEKIETRQQAAQIIHQRIFPDDPNADIDSATHYYGIPIDEYKSAIHQVHKVNAVENVEIDRVHKVNAVEDPDEDNDIHQVHKVNAVMNSVVNCRSSSSNINTTTDTEFTDEHPELVYPEFETPNELAICKLHIARLERKHQQLILDELSARMINPKKEKLDNPIGYLTCWLIKTLNEGGIPYTSEGAKLAANRDNPTTNKTSTGDQNQQELERNLHADITTLNRLINFEETLGKKPTELIQQRDEKINQLAQSRTLNTA